MHVFTADLTNFYTRTKTKKDHKFVRIPKSEVSTKSMRQHISTLS